jgi:hypothetical protein
VLHTHRTFDVEDVDLNEGRRVALSQSPPTDYVDPVVTPEADAFAGA